MKLIGYNSDSVYQPKKKPRATKKYFDADCCYCGRELNILTFTYDHLIPKSKGGRNLHDNKRPCCQNCNTWKGDKTLSEFLEIVIEKRPLDLKMINRIKDLML